MATSQRLPISVAYRETEIRVPIVKPLLQFIEISIQMFGRQLVIHPHNGTYLCVFRSHCPLRKRFVVQADEKLTAFMERELATSCAKYKSKKQLFASGTAVR